MADQNNAPEQTELEGILEPGAPEAPPELVGGQPQVPLPPERERVTPSEERLNKALSTIEGLQREIADLKGRPPQVVYQGEPRREAVPEMIEVLPGRRIPKDPEQRAIKLRAEDLLAMGWNEDPARALNALANAFFHHIAEVVPAITLAHLEDTNRTRHAGASRQDTFFRDYPDLKEFSDLANIVEQQTMQEIPMQGMSQSEWNREVGTRVRQRIAAMRGISLEQYTASHTARSGGSGGRSRAVTAPPARGARVAPTNDQQREMDDLIDGRL